MPYTGKTIHKVKCGVFVAVNHCITSHAIVTFDSECEIVWTNIQRRKRPSLYVGSFYRTPTSGHDHMATLQLISSQPDTIIYWTFL